MKLTIDTPAKVAGAIAALAALVSAFWWFVAPRVDEYIRNTVNGAASRCVSIPPSGHYIESARPGEWATVEWRNIERLRQCSTPELTAVVVNGDGIFHDVPLSVSGVNLDPGVTPVLRYRFKIPSTAKPGSAWFRVTLNFPQDGRTINSPRVFFQIID